MVKRQTALAYFSFIQAFQFLVKIQMNSPCQRCASKPAVSICLKGRLCFACGNKCHGQYQHPVEFIRHCNDTTQPDRKTIKSSTIISTTKSLKQLPKRVTKVSSKLCLTRVKNQSGCKKTTTEGSLFNQSNKQNNRLQLNSSKAKLKDSKKSIGVMAQGSAHQQHQEVLMLKRKLAKQEEVIKMLCERLKKQKSEKQTISKNYQQKLKFIRNLRD